jgi:hypothetical protein
MMLLIGKTIAFTYLKIESINSESKFLLDSQRAVQRSFYITENIFSLIIVTFMLRQQIQNSRDTSSDQTTD